MEHLPEFIRHHPFYVALIVAAAVAVLVYELRQRAHHSGAIGAQDAIRLMNQGPRLSMFALRPPLPQAIFPAPAHYRPKSSTRPAWCSSATRTGR